MKMFIVLKITLSAFRKKNPFIYIYIPILHILSHVSRPAKESLAVVPVI